jgi:integrase
MSGRDVYPQVEAAILAYRPTSVGEAAGAFARELVAQACPQSPARAKAFLFAAGRLAGFGESVGLELRAQVLLEPSVIERFIICGCGGLSLASVRTLRCNLRALARSLVRHPEPCSVPLARERAKTPYCRAEIEGYLRLACCQSTEARRMRCRALICLGAGAGIVGCELRYIKGSDVIEAHGGLLVRVAGRRARSVPVLSRYQEPLLRAAVFAGESFILGGRDPARRNISDSLAAALSADPGLPRLQAGRLRATWLAQLAQQIGLHTFMAAAGIRCSQRLGDIAPHLPVPGEAEMMALLGGSS